MEKISKIVYAVFIVCILAYGGTYVIRGWKSQLAATERKEVQAEQEKRDAAEKQAVGPLAESAATLLAKASRECQKISYEDLYECAKHQSILPKEKEIASIANDAVTSHARFAWTCDKYYSHEECISLLWRASNLTKK